jgi:hypothetical protein
MAPLPSSPGEAVYLHISDSDRGPGIVWRFAPDQGLLEQVSPDKWEITAFDVWPGDGRVAYGVSASLFVVLPGQFPQLLYDASEWADYSPVVDSVAWSPDGTRLAYTVTAEHPWNATHATTSQFDGLWLLTLEGERTQLASNAYCEQGLMSRTGAQNAVLPLDWVHFAPVWT